MKNKTVSIILACAIGAGLGSILALKFGAFWAVGFLIGGVVGYLAYDFKSAIKAIPVAWSYVKKERKEIVSIAVMIAKMIGIIIGVLVLMFGIPFSYVIFVKYIGLYDITSYVDKSVVALYAIGHVIGSLICLLLNLSKNIKISSSLGILVLILSPLSMVVLTFYYGYYGIIVFGKFSWKFFKLVHSDLRLLVGIDSVIGGAVGYYFESPIIGMMAGAVWGWVNYQIVSLRLLKLKPVH